MGFDDLEHYRDWAEEDIQALRMVAEMVGLYWDRKQTAETLNKTEAQLRHAIKMEAVGRLAGGVAHDFNNLLTVIIGDTELAELSLRENDPLKAEIGEILVAANRGSELTRQLLAFSRKQTLQPAIVDLNQIITNLEKMLRRIIGEDISLVTVPDQALAKVKVDPGQIEQVITNLVVNARDAYILLSEMKEPIDLLITDVIMPNMSGPKLVEKLKLFLPDLKVLYISGYTADAINATGIIDADLPYLQKPFRPIAFAQKVRQVLDS